MNTIRILNKLNNLNPIKMNQELTQGTESYEVKEQREPRRMIEILKRWEIKIQPLDRGCTVSVGCKSFAFESLGVAIETVKQYIDNPFDIAKEYEFEDYI